MHFYFYVFFNEVSTVITQIIVKVKVKLSLYLTN
jgi:hypothetical protein